MPIPGAKYRVKQTAKGPVRLAFQPGGQVVEAKNMQTGATHTPAEFRRDRMKRKAGPKPTPKTKGRMKLSPAEIQARMRAGEDFEV